MIVFGSNYGQLGQGRFEVRWDPRRLGKTKMSKLFFRLIRHYLGRRFIAGARFEPTTLLSKSLQKIYVTLLDQGPVTEKFHIT